MSNIARFIEEVRSIKPYTWCIIFLAIVAICFLFINAPELQHSSDTQLVRRELRKMGFVNEAESLVLESTSQAGVYRASIPVQGEDGLIEYWKRHCFIVVWPHFHVRMLPYFEYI